MRLSKAVVINLFLRKNGNIRFNSITITRDQKKDFRMPMSLIHFTTFNHNKNSIFVKK